MLHWNKVSVTDKERTNRRNPVMYAPYFLLSSHCSFGAGKRDPLDEKAIEENIN
jgi:hypothetical protein